LGGACQWMVQQLLMKRPGKQAAASSNNASPIKSGQMKPVFGRSLQELYEAYGGLPPVFWDSLRLLSLRALTIPGLFRPQPTGQRRGRSASSGSGGGGLTQTGSGSSDSGSSDGGGSEDGGSGRKVLLCKRLYDSGQDALKVLPSTTKDVHAIAGILKLWVQSLPEAVVPPSLYEAALATQTDYPGRRADQVAALHTLLRQCEHRVLQVLYPLMEFLHHYCLNQRQPAMERAELARLFAPLVLRPVGRSVMAPANDDGLAAQCVEHMIREYRTMFVARKRAIVPPSLPACVPACGGKSNVSVTATAPPAIAATVTEPEGGLAPVRPGLAPVRTQGDIAITASEQAAYDALPDSPIGGSGSEPWADAQLDEAMSELLFSSTSVLFQTEVPRQHAHIHEQQQQQQQNFFSVSPTSSPDRSPQRLHPMGEENGGDNCFRPTIKSAADHPLASPISVSAGWGNMSEGSSDDSGCDDSTTSSDGVRCCSIDSALMDGDHSVTNAAAARQSAADAAQQHQQQQTFADAAAADAACFALVEAGAHALTRPAGEGTQGAGTNGGGGSEGCGVFQMPSVKVKYDAPLHGDAQTAVVAQLAAEKAALKRQLRQLDADFEASTGRAPGRAEKEALRPLYVRYWRLKRALALASSGPSGPPAPSPTPQPLPASAGPTAHPIMMES